MAIDWKLLDTIRPRLRDAPAAGPSLLRDLASAWHLPDDALTAFTRRLAIDVAGFEIDVSLSPAELFDAYLPVIRLIHEHPRRPRRRLLVALAGIPGSGKSTTLALIGRIWENLQLTPPLCCLSMDGYHRPNAVLNQRGLRHRKGCPDSFDAAALRCDLEFLQQASTVVNLPRYDRTRHEPVPAAIRVTAAQKIIFFEGNYLLSAKNSWATVSRLFDVRFFLDTPSRAARAALIARHQRGGSSPSQALERVTQNDELNARYVLPTRANADLIIEADENHRLVRAIRPD